MKLFSFLCLNGYWLLGHVDYLNFVLWDIFAVGYSRVWTLNLLFGGEARISTLVARSNRGLIFDVYADVMGYLDRVYLEL